MMRLFRFIKKDLEKKRQYSEEMYQRWVAGYIGWSITFVVYALYFIKMLI